MGLSEMGVSFEKDGDFVTQIICGNSLFHRVGECPICGMPIWAQASDIDAPPMTQHACDCHKEKP